MDISKFEKIVQNVCKIYLLFFALFLAIQPDLNKTIEALAWGSRIVAQNHNNLIFLGVLILIMAIGIYQSGGN